MITPLCTVRGCAQPLAREERRFVCANGHSFDVARSGYLNLLQPQDRRSRAPGDSPEAVAARRRFLDAGHAAPLVRAIVDALPLRANDALLDAGCGEGHHLTAFRHAYGVDAHGVDISVPAIELAARRDRECTWIVANADRFLPFADASFRAVTSITARLNPAEFHRVLAANGTLLVAVAGADDLIELREAILGERIERDRTDRTIDLFTPLFHLERREHVRHVAQLDRNAMIDVTASSYRALRKRERERLEQLDAMNVTLSRDILLMRKLT
ncbi:MAG TPA: methyltransferase domain-containing protein [Thermoanaerobaculia bacterium]|nr:methyltransferase domain-containing protein [Thermoanaerobaculia bacterium]